MGTVGTGVSGYNWVDRVPTTVAELIAALAKIDPSFSISIGYEGTHNALVAIEVHPDGVENRHWVPDQSRPDLDSKQFLIAPRTVVLRTH
jgi:hypothetical protein